MIGEKSFNRSASAIAYCQTQTINLYSYIALIISTCIKYVLIKQMYLVD